LRAVVSPGSAPRHCGRLSWRGLAAFDHAGLAAGTTVETIGPGCRVGLFPAGPGLVYWFVQLTRRPDLTRITAPRAWLAERLATWPEPIPDVLAATADEAVIETPITELLPQPRWHVGNLLLIGDAAHGMTPDLGRGACTAIEDAVAFAAALGRLGSFSRAAASFSRSRRWRSWLLQHASRLAGTVRQLQSPMLCALRNAVWRWSPPLVALRLITPVIAGLASGSRVRSLR
jgi:2-polyprenyl-6-methoxyphenol hydroxylase-like FAD-dependent oxidoreductase